MYWDLETGNETTYRSHVIKEGTPNPPITNTKYEYRTTSVTLHATSIELYAGLYCVVCGKLYAMPQTRRKRDATCMRVVSMGARTTPIYPI